MKRAKDSPKVQVRESKPKDVVTSSLSKKPMFDTNYYYYYFTEVQQQQKK